MVSTIGVGSTSVAAGIVSGCLVCHVQADPRGQGGSEGESFAIGLTVCFKAGRRVSKIYTSDWCRDTGSLSYQREVSV